MTLEIISLRQVFPDIFRSRNAVDYGAILSMIAVEDTLGGEIYSYDTTIATESIAKSTYENSGGAFTLYIRTSDKDGNVSYVAIDNPDTLVASTTELFLKKTSSSPVEFVSIYGLIHIDFKKVSNNQKIFQDTAIRIAALIYSISCLERRMFMLHIEDLNASVAEQKLMNRVMAQLQQLENDLISLDGQEQNESTATILAEILAFFIQRDLVSISAATGVVTQDVVDNLREILAGRIADATSGKRNIGAIASFQDWTQLHALMNHGSFFLLGTTISVDLAAQDSIKQAIMNLHEALPVSTKQPEEGAVPAEGSLGAKLDGTIEIIQEKIQNDIQATLEIVLNPLIQATTDIQSVGEPINTFKNALISLLSNINLETTQWGSIVTKMEEALATLKSAIETFCRTEYHASDEFVLQDNFVPSISLALQNAIVDMAGNKIDMWRYDADDHRAVAMEQMTGDRDTGALFTAGNPATGNPGTIEGALETIWAKYTDQLSISAMQIFNSVLGGKATKTKEDGEGNLVGAEGSLVGSVPNPVDWTTDPTKLSNGPKTEEDFDKFWEAITQNISNAVTELSHDEVDTLVQNGLRNTMYVALSLTSAQKTRLSNAIQAFIDKNIQAIERISKTAGEEVSEAGSLADAYVPNDATSALGWAMSISLSDASGFAGEIGKFRGNDTFESWKSAQETIIKNYIKGKMQASLSTGLKDSLANAMFNQINSIVQGQVTDATLPTMVQVVDDGGHDLYLLPVTVTVTEEVDDDENPETPAVPQSTTTGYEVAVWLDDQTDSENPTWVAADQSFQNSDAIAAWSAIAGGGSTWPRADHADLLPKMKAVDTTLFQILGNGSTSWTDLVRKVWDLCKSTGTDNTTYGVLNSAPISPTLFLELEKLYLAARMDWAKSATWVNSLMQQGSAGGKDASNVDAFLQARCDNVLSTTTDGNAHYDLLDKIRDEIVGTKDTYNSETGDWSPGTDSTVEDLIKECTSTNIFQLDQPKVIQAISGLSKTFLEQAIKDFFPNAALQAVKENAEEFVIFARFDYIARGSGLSESLANIFARDIAHKIMNTGTESWQMQENVLANPASAYGATALTESLKTHMNSWKTAIYNELATLEAGGIAAIAKELEDFITKIKTAILTAYNRSAEDFSNLGQALQTLRAFDRLPSLDDVMASGLSSKISYAIARAGGAKKVTGVPNAIVDMYSSMYWFQASEIKDLPFAGIMGGEDHWVFDPRQRDSSGTILNRSGDVWDGTTTDAEDDNSPAYFPGFGPVTLKEDYLPENASDYVNPKGEQSKSEAPETLTYPDYSVRWFGPTPPKSQVELETGMAARLRKIYGSSSTEHSFLPQACFNSGTVSSFSSDFKALIGANPPATGSGTEIPPQPDPEIQLSWIGDGSFHVSQFFGSGPDPDNASNTKNITFNATSISGSTTTAAIKSSVLGPECTNRVDFWPLPLVDSTILGGGEVDALIVPLRKTAQLIEMNQNKVSVWRDALRIYVEQISSDSSWRSSAINLAMTKSQEAVAEANSFMATVEKLRDDPVANIR
ncbi:MAG: hypothetical protein LBP65_00175 [Puniceicoccales bacterium]|jgi:hypothetical protein|nr:hypothetical protein [Puniceicoccales bacterium]